MYLSDSFLVFMCPVAKGRGLKGVSLSSARRQMTAPDLVSHAGRREGGGVEKGLGHEEDGDDEGK